MRFAVLLALCGALVLPAAGAAAGRTAGADVPEIAWGAADDASKFADDGGPWFYGELERCEPHAEPLDARVRPERTRRRSTSCRSSSGPRPRRRRPACAIILVALFAQGLAARPRRSSATGRRQVATTVNQWGIHDFVVGNEVNTRLYWSPQKDAKGKDVAAPAYLALLAHCYDMIHEADPDANVIGMGLSPRASTNQSNEPLVFLRDVGKAYRASGRTTPIMDQLSVHPYPNPGNPTDGPGVGYDNPDRFGVPNLDRVKQAVYDAFNGTGQPTTLERR